MKHYIRLWAPAPRKLLRREDIFKTKDRQLCTLVTPQFVGEGRAGNITAQLLKIAARVGGIADPSAHTEAIGVCTWRASYILVERCHLTVSQIQHLALRITCCQSRGFNFPLTPCKSRRRRIEVLAVRAPSLANLVPLYTPAKFRLIHGERTGKQVRFLQSWRYADAWLHGTA